MRVCHRCLFVFQYKKKTKQTERKTFKRHDCVTGDSVSSFETSVGPFGRDVRMLVNEWDDYLKKSGTLKHMSAVKKKNWGEDADWSHAD